MSKYLAFRAVQGPTKAVSPFLRLGIDYVNGPVADTATKQQVIRDTCLIQNTHILGFNMGVGAGRDGNGDLLTTSSTPFDQTNDLPVLDARISGMMAAARHAKGELCITLYSPPWWMYDNPNVDWTGPNNFYDLRLPSSNFDAWADYCAFLAARYPSVKYFSVWNEYKGFWNSGANRWAYEEWTEMYNKVYTAIKAARPDAMVGGPYINMSTTQKTSAGGGQNGVPRTSSLPRPSGVSNAIEATGWYQDGRQLDVLLYFQAHAVGYDFITFDGNIYSSVNTSQSYMASETVTDSGGNLRLKNPEKVAMIASWIKSLFPHTPIWCTESYWGNGYQNINPDNSKSWAQEFIDQAVASPLDVALIWHQSAGIADLLFDAGGSGTPLGDMWKAYQDSVV